MMEYGLPLVVWWWWCDELLMMTECSLMDDDEIIKKTNDGRSIDRFFICTGFYLAKSCKEMIDLFDPAYLDPAAIKEMTGEQKYLCNRIFNGDWSVKRIPQKLFPNGLKFMKYIGISNIFLEVVWKYMGISTHFSVKFFSGQVVISRFGVRRTQKSHQLPCSLYQHKHHACQHEALHPSIVTANQWTIN